MARLAILGGGFMGGALAAGLVESGWEAEEIVVAEKVGARRAELGGTLGVRTTASALDAASSSPTVLVAVKPQDVLAVLDTVRPAFDQRRLVISICAGVLTATFEESLGTVPIVRAMPNTPASVGKGATAIAPGRHAEPEDLETARSILGAVGEVAVVDESQLDAVTAVSGSGPAYVFYLAQAMLEAAQTLGLDEAQSRTLVYQTMEGAVALLRTDPASPAELRARVTSPGGTTQAAVEHLESREWADALADAMTAARDRSIELAAG